MSIVGSLFLCSSVKYRSICYFVEFNEQLHNFAGINIWIKYDANKLQVLT